MMRPTKARKEPPLMEPATFGASPVNGVTAPLPVPAVALIVPDEPAETEEVVAIPSLEEGRAAVG